MAAERNPGAGRPMTRVVSRFTTSPCATMRGAMVRLSFHAGTLEVHGLDEGSPLAPAGARWDPRTACHRAPAMAYAETVLALRRAGVAYEDEARAYDELSSGALARYEPRPYQAEALAAWKKRKGRGVVVLPTGDRKSAV